MLRAFHRYLAWAWIIIVGVIMITPGGIICIACGPQAAGYLGVTVIRAIGVVTILVGLVGLAAQPTAGMGERQ